MLMLLSVGQGRLAGCEVGGAKPPLSAQLLPLIPLSYPTVQGILVLGVEGGGQEALGIGDLLKVRLAQCVNATNKAQWQVQNLVLDISVASLSGI